MIRANNGVPLNGMTVEQLTPHPSWVRFWKRLIEIELEQAERREAAGEPAQVMSMDAASDAAEGRIDRSHSVFEGLLGNER